MPGSDKDLCNATGGVSEVQTSIHFLKKTTLYETEKPYAFRYHDDNIDVPQSNMRMENHHKITVTNLRSYGSPLSFEQNGFAVLNLQSQLNPEDFYDTQRLPVYFRELEDLLKSWLGADHVKVFRHGVCCSLLL